MSSVAYDLDQPIPMTPREFTEFTVNIRGQPIDLDRRPWLHHIYDQPFVEYPGGRYRRKMLMIFGRQCEKSTTIGNMLLSMSNLVPYLRSLYISASDIQMREFSDERLRAVINDSEKLMKLTRAVDGKAETQNVQTKRWRNQSKILLRSVYRSADRARGISADNLGVDEIQDIYTDVLPVIEETQFASDLEGGPIALYAGTPKTFDNSLEIYWSRFSTQNEWAVKCLACRHHNVIEIENITPKGLVCIKCRKPIDPMRNGQWARLGRQDAPWEGFRVPQPVVIYAYAHKPLVFERKWRDLVQKQTQYTRSKFQNEVMARSYDSGTKPVSFEEVRRCCLPDRSFVKPEEITRQLKATHTYAGVDWGTGDESFTIISIWRYDAEGRFSLIFAKRYEGVEADPDHTIQDMIQWFRKFNVNRIGADWGFGFHANPKLMKAFGANKVLTYYHAGSQKEKVKWDKLGMKFVTHRTRVLGDVFNIIKRGPVSGGVAFTNWDEFETFANDLLAVVQENNEKRGELVDRLEDMAHMLLDAMGVDIQENGVDAVRAATAMGITVDKLQLLKGEPTGIVQVVRMLQDGPIKPEQVRAKWPNIADSLFSQAGVTVEDRT